MTFVLTEDVRICNNGFVIGVGGCTVGDKSGVTFCVVSKLSDLMSNSLAEMACILRYEGDNVAFLQSGRICFFYKYQSTCVKVCCRHGVGVYDV